MTNYELWQLEKYGNILPESDAQPIQLEEEKLIISEYHPELLNQNQAHETDTI